MTKRVRMRAIDLETAGMDPPASIIEIGWTDLLFDPVTKTTIIGETFSMLFRPREKLTPDNIAVHHLTPAALADWPHCELHDLQALARDECPDFLVAANVDFEKKWLTPDITDPAKWICTVKVAAQVYPEAPSCGNQAMRYELGLDLPDARAMPPHRAGPDSYVTACILAEFLKTETVNDMVNWTKLPRNMPLIPIGKHRGKRWTDVDHGFLDWCMRTKDLDADVHYAAQLEIDRRRNHGPAQ